MKKKLVKKNPVAKNMYTGETGFKPQTQTHKSKKKYSRKKNKKIITKEKDDLN